MANQLKPSQRTASPTSDLDYDSDDLALPFPTPLPRSDFLTPDFDPSTYLSSLGHRHQTLEDLRADLRQRSQLLSQELVELVNARYEDFLSLGGSVSGGEERAEELRVGLLALRREVETVRKNVEERETEMEVLVRERKEVRRDVELGRRLVDFESRISRLESRVAGTKSSANTGNEDEDEAIVSDDSLDEEDEDEEDLPKGVLPVPKLRRRAEELVALERFRKKMASHAFVASQRERLMKLRNVILVDLEAALKHADDKADKTIELMALYRGLGAARNAVDVFKKTSKKK